MTVTLLAMAGDQNERALPLFAATDSLRERVRFHRIWATGPALTIEQDRYSILVGSDARFMDFIYRLNPKGAAGFIYKQMKSLLPA